VNPLAGRHKHRQRAQRVSGEANSGRFLNQPARVFIISLFSRACPVMVAGVFVYAEQLVIGMGCS